MAHPTRTTVRDAPTVTCPRCTHTGMVSGGILRYRDDVTHYAGCAACGADLHPVTFADLGTTDGGD